MCHRPVRIGRLTDSCDALLLTGCGLELMTGPGKRGRVGGSQAGSRTLLPSPAPASLSALAPCRYTYYAFAAMRVRPNPIPAILLTTGQLLQMAVGVCIHAVCFYLYYVEGNVYKGVQVRQPRQLRAMPPVMSELTARSVSAGGADSLPWCGCQCGVSIENTWAGALMYMSYFILFLRLFYKKYILNEQVDMGIPKTKRRKAE
jgi:hypothetical protein